MIAQNVGELGPDLFEGPGRHVFMALDEDGEPAAVGRYRGADGAGAEPADGLEERGASCVVEQTIPSLSSWSVPRWTAAEGNGGPSATCSAMPAAASLLLKNATRTSAVQERRNCAAWAS